MHSDAPAGQAAEAHIAPRDRKRNAAKFDRHDRAKAQLLSDILEPNHPAVAVVPRTEHKHVVILEHTPVRSGPQLSELCAEVRWEVDVWRIARHRPVAIAIRTV